MNATMKATIEKFYSPGGLNTYKKDFISEQVQKEFADARKEAELVDSLLNKKLNLDTGHLTIRVGFQGCLC
jgi:hypothetical protein